MSCIHALDNCRVCVAEALASEIGERESRVLAGEALHLHLLDEITDSMESMLDRYCLGCALDALSRAVDRFMEEHEIAERVRDFAREIAHPHMCGACASRFFGRPREIPFKEIA